MRSPKSRSRSKSNRGNNRSPANNINRVFDSSGPEGKVRGTPQQIIDKYNQLARDAHLGNDRVAAENFQQHAEHYTRMLAEAQRDAEESRARAEQQNRERQQAQQPRQQQQPQQQPQAQQPRQQQQPQQQPQAQQQPQQQPQGQQQPQPQGQAPKPKRERQERAPVDELPGFITAPAGGEGATDVVDAADSGLVETPESTEKKKPAPRARKPRTRKPAADTAQPAEPSDTAQPAKPSGSGEGSDAAAE